MKCKNITTGKVVLIRAYGKKSELLIDRQAELLVRLQGNVYSNYFRPLSLCKKIPSPRHCIVDLKMDLYTAMFKEHLPNRGKCTSRPYFL